MTELEQLIREEIRDRGPMRFDRFMAMALYHPACGYYAGERPIGRKGDYFTSVSVGPLFGRLLARQARQVWRLLGQPAAFLLVEQGAHEGRLAIDLLEAARELDSDFFQSLRYHIVEPLPLRRDAQKQQIADARIGSHVSWSDSIAQISGQAAAGLFLSNELVDSFPVRLIVRRAESWRERHVDLGRPGVFSWVDLPVCDSGLQEVIDRLPLPRIEGYTTEINLEARRWMHEVARYFERGYVMTVDYGFPASVYYAPFRRGGTLTTYRQHRRGADVLAAPGESDITAHVDFTTLARAGEAAGFTTLGLVDQQRFLMGVAHDELSGGAVFDQGVLAHGRAWSTLTHPGHLGSRFQVLIQAKNAPAGLDGLRHARPGGLD